MMSNPGAKMGLRRPPFAFTEHGALMAATVLNSPRAVEMSLYVVRAFVRMREVLTTHKALARKLDELVRKEDRNARAQARHVRRHHTRAVQGSDRGSARPYDAARAEEAAHRLCQTRG